MDKKLKQILGTIAKLIISALFFWIIWNKVDLSSVWNYMKTAHILWLFMALISFLLSKLISAFRLYLFYRTQKIKLQAWFLIKFYLLSMFYNIFLPFLGGEGFKVFFLKKNFNISYKSVIWSTLLDRVSGLAILSCLAILFFIFIPDEIPNKIFMLLLIPTGIGIYYYIHQGFFHSFHAVWGKALFFSTGVQLTQLATAFFLLLALDTPSAHLSYLFIFLMASFAYIIPIMGVRELIFVYGADMLHLNMELSLTVSLFFYVSLLISSVLGILFFLFPNLYSNGLAKSQELTKSLQFK